MEHENELASEFFLTVAFSLELLNRLIEEAANHTSFDDVGVYIDDGYASLLRLPLGELSRHCRVAVAVVTSMIGKPDFLTWADLRSLVGMGVSVLPHGISHVALAAIQNGRVLNTPPGESGQLLTTGKLQQLNSNSVRLQLVRPLEVLRPLGRHIDEFVLPYGLYNAETLRINQDAAAYRYLATCEPFLDVGSALRPRVILTSGQSIESTFARLCKLTPLSPNHKPAFL